jgi:hypothetical protein
VFHPDDWAGRYRRYGTYGTASGPSDGEMRMALAELPPGHPSSARKADGTPRPLPPRLQDLELPLPGTSADTPAQGPAEGPASDGPRNDAATREPPAL